MKMTFLIVSRKHFSINCFLHKLVFLIIVFSSLALNVSTANLGASASGVLKSSSADPSVSSTEKFCNNLRFDQSAVLEKISCNNSGDQTKLLDKWIGKQMSSFTIGKGKPIDESQTSDSVGIHTPPYMNFVYASLKRRNEAVCSSSVITMSKNAHIASDEVLQSHTIAVSNNIVMQAQPQEEAILRSSNIDDVEGTDESGLDNYIDDSLEISSLAYSDPNIQNSLKKCDRFLTHDGIENNSKEYGLSTTFTDDEIEDIIVSNEYSSVIPVTLYGTGTTVVSFKGHKDHIVNIVLQLRGHRYDPTVSEYNCENTRISAQLRSASSDYQLNGTGPSQFPNAIASNSGSHTIGKLSKFVKHNLIRDDTKATLEFGESNANSKKVYKFEESTDNFEDFYEDKPNRLWSSFAQLFDTSLLCEILPSISLRIPKVEEEQDLNFIIRGTVQSTKWHNSADSNGSWDQGNVCSIQVYISQTPARRLKMNQIIFAVFIPLLVLLMPLPFFLRRADIIQVASLSINVVDYIWYPPYLLRRIIISGIIRLKVVVQTAWHQRRLRNHQKRLEMQQRALAERMNTSLAEGQNGPCRRGDRQQKDVDIPLGFPIQAQQEEIVSSSPILATIGVAATENMSFPNEDEEEGPSVTLVDQPMREPNDGNEGSMNPLSRPMITIEPATTVVVVKLTSHFTTAKDPPSRPHLEYDDVAGVGDDRPIAVSLQKQGIVDGTPAEHASAASCTSGGNGPTSQELLFPSGPCCEEGDDVEEDGRFCRICRDGEEDEALVAPCNCTGSVRWVHLSCLDHWRLESIKRNISNYNTCEICKSPFKITVRRSILIWQSCKRILYAIILIITCALCFMMIPLISHSIFGEASCVAEYHRVPYATMYQFDGIMLSLFVYVEIVLSVILARLIVFSWFRSDPEVETYIAEVHVIPRFMTWRNVLKIGLVTLVIIAQAISIGYLVKVFMYATSEIVWNWEASPLLGGIVFILFIFLAIGVSVSLREYRIQAQSRQQQTAMGDVVENMNTRSSPHVNPDAEGVGATETRIILQISPAS